MIPIAAPVIGEEEIAAVTRVMRSGVIAQGPEVAAFEEEFGALVAGRHCIAVNAGTSALHLGLLAAGVGPGDEIIVPSFSFAATANAVRLVGAEPVFVDIDPVTYCIDPAAVEAAVTSRTAAVMPVHLYGHPAAMHELTATAERHGLLVLEDAAQAHGAALDGRPVGTWGQVAAFSFYPTKNMTTGEGGMIVTADEDLARRARLLRNQGMERRHHNEIVGFNARMTDIGAAIGRVQLRKLGGWNERRRGHAVGLSERLGARPELTVPTEVGGARHVYHQYTIRVSQGRDELVSELHSRGVGAGVYYPVPIHRLPSFDLELDLPATDAAAAEVISLPVHPTLDADQLATVGSEVADAVTA